MLKNYPKNVIVSLCSLHIQSSIVLLEPRPHSLSIPWTYCTYDKMERFLSNCKPSLHNRAKPNANKHQLEKRRKYETKKRTAFNLSWKIIYSWLEYHIVTDQGDALRSQYNHSKIRKQTIGHILQSFVLN